MQTTQNYGLKKPEDNDLLTPDDFNDNMDMPTSTSVCWW